MQRGGAGAVLPVLKPEELRKWRERIPPLRYRTGQTLFYEGHYPHGLYVIHSGTLLLKARRRSRSKKILLSAGSAVGLDLILRDQTYPWTAVAQDDVEFSFIGRNEVIRRVGRRDALLSSFKAAAGHGVFRSLPESDEGHDSEE